MIVRQVLCGVLLKYMHKNYTQYILKMIFLDSCLVLCECCGQFEGLASCVESPLTSSSQSNTYKILQLFSRTTIMSSEAQSQSYKILQLFFCTNIMGSSHKHRAAKPL